MSKWWDWVILTWWLSQTRSTMIGWLLKCLLDCFGPPWFFPLFWGSISNKCSSQPPIIPARAHLRYALTGHSLSKVCNLLQISWKLILYSSAPNYGRSSPQGQIRFLSFLSTYLSLTPQMQNTLIWKKWNLVSSFSYCGNALRWICSITSENKRWAIFVGLDSTPKLAWPPIPQILFLNKWCSPKIRGYPCWFPDKPAMATSGCCAGAPWWLVFYYVSWWLMIVILGHETILIRVKRWSIVINTDYLYFIYWLWSLIGNTIITQQTHKIKHRNHNI